MDNLNKMETSEDNMIQRQHTAGINDDRMCIMKTNTTYHLRFDKNRERNTDMIFRINLNVMG